MPTKPSESPPDARSQSGSPTSLPERIEAHREALVKARDQLRLQLNGVDNQLYILDQLLNPKPEPTPAASSETPPGTI